MPAQHVPAVVLVSIVVQVHTSAFSVRTGSMQLPPLHLNAAHAQAFTSSRTRPARVHAKRALLVSTAAAVAAAPNVLQAANVLMGAPALLVQKGLTRMRLAAALARFVLFVMLRAHGPQAVLEQLRATVLTVFPASLSTPLRHVWPVHPTSFRA